MKQPTCNCGRVISSKLRKIPHKFDKRCERILEQQAEQDAWNTRDARFYDAKPVSVSNASWEAGVPERGEI